MVSRQKSDQNQAFYEFRLGDALPDHPLQRVDAALGLSCLRS
jgi:hypothetical protein